MYGLNRLKSANHLRPLFTAAAAAPHSERLLRSLPFTYFSRRWAAKIAGIDDLVYVGEGGKIRGKEENEAAISEGFKTYERKVLPPELLSKNVAMLTCESSAHGGICDVYLVGTCHVSDESRREVEAVIEFLKPQVVFLELCSSRVATLTRKHFKVPTGGDLLTSLCKNQNPLGIFFSWQQAKIARKLKVVPGAEFSAAYEQAMKYGGKIVLGDRPARITMRRISAKMLLWDMIKLGYAFLFQKGSLPISEDLAKTLKGINVDDKLTLMKEINNVDVLSLIDEISNIFPTLMEPLIHERDKYMSATLLKVASEHNSVVAVVGKGHLAGIQKNWKQPVQLKQLLNIPD